MNATINASMRSDSQRDQRQLGKDARRNLDTDLREEYSYNICRQFLRSGFFYRANTIACYLPIDAEVDTSLIFEHAWRAGKSIFAPVLETNRKMRFVRISRNTRMERNLFGIYEPVATRCIAPEKLDVVVTPVVAFDDKCNRIGMGGGYFDRTFSFLGSRGKWAHPKLTGFAFACQKVEKICTNPWDIRLFQVFSETR